MPDDGDFEDRLDELEALVKTVNAKVDDMFSRRIEILEETADEQTDEIDSLRNEVADLGERVGTLERKFAGLAGLKDHEQSTPEKRREDLVLALQRKAEDGSGKDDNGRASMTYEDILDQWAVLNHGRLDPKQAYRAMKSVSEIDGISLTENGDDQQVVRMNLKNFDASTGEESIDNVNNAEERSGPANAASTGD